MKNEKSYIRRKNVYMENVGNVKNSISSSFNQTSPPNRQRIIGNAKIFFLKIFCSENKT